MGSEHAERIRGPESLGLDGFAVKPTQHEFPRVRSLAPDRVVLDFEGRSALPAWDEIAALAERIPSLRMTIPIRADGFDPLGDADLLDRIPDEVGRVFVPGNGTYLDDHEKRRSIAERMAAATARHPNAWVGTESIERLALVTGATQFELLSGDTSTTIAGLRRAGFEGELAVYAPFVRSTDDDEILDALGPYVARRPRVASALPGDASPDSAATGEVRDVLLEAAGTFGFVGTEREIANRAHRLRAIGCDFVIGYPADGLPEHQ